MSDEANDALNDLQRRIRAFTDSGKFKSTDDLVMEAFQETQEGEVNFPSARILLAKYVTFPDIKTKN